MNITLAAPTDEAPGRFRLPARQIKIGIAAGIALVGLYGLLCEQRYVTSSGSVMSAYVLDVRTPSDGIVTGLPLSVGSRVSKGQLLGRVDGTRTDRAQLETLRSEEGSAAATAEATSTERAALISQQRGLISRASEHREAVVKRLLIEQEEQARTLAALKLQLSQALLELDRGRQLHDAGILASAPFDLLVSTHSVLTQEVGASQAKLDSLSAEVDAARLGIFTEPGNGTDVGYSRQRADEIAMRISESERSISTFRAQANLAHLALVSETQRFNQLERRDILSPIDGVLWKFKVVDGERAATGDTIISLVDCTRQFLLVSIPQDRVPEIALHEHAIFRLAGETAEHVGTVQSVLENLDDAGGQKLATMPFRRAGEQVATVVVTLDTAAASTEAPGCLVGRTARVLLPTIPMNTFSRLARRYF